MAKKKVVKHSSKIKKNVTSKHAVVHKRKKHEEVIIEPQIEEQIETPVQQKQEPIMKPVTAVLATDQDSIYAEEKPKEPVVKPENVAQSDRLKSLAIVLSIIIIILWGMLMIASIQHNTALEIVEHNVTTRGYTNATIDIAEYANVSNLKYTEKVSLIGYLNKETVQIDATTKIDTKYIVDDYGKKIAIDLGYNSKYEPLFISNYTTDYTFRVQGTFRYRSGIRNMFIIEATTITPVDRPQVLKEINTTTYENVTIGKGYTLNLTKGWNRLTGK